MMKIEITNTTLSQTVTLRDGSAMIDDVSGRLFIRRFDAEGTVTACMSTDKPHAIDILRDRAVISFREENEFKFSTDYFTNEHGCDLLKNFGDESRTACC